MFLCDFCGKPCGPRIKPRIVITETRPIEYLNKDEDGLLSIGSAGFETVTEGKQCPECYPEGTSKPPVEVKPNYSGYRAIANAIPKHSTGCKKLLSECMVCQKIISDLAKFPLPALSYALAQAQIPVGTSSFAELTTENMMARTYHKTKRAKADFEMSFGVLKAYEQRGGSL